MNNTININEENAKILKKQGNHILKNMIKGIKRCEERDFLRAQTEAEDNKNIFIKIFELAKRVIKDNRC